MVVSMVSVFIGCYNLTVARQPNSIATQRNSSQVRSQAANPVTPNYADTLLTLTADDKTIQHCYTLH